MVLYENHVLGVISNLEFEAVPKLGSRDLCRCGSSVNAAAEY